MKSVGDSKSAAQVQKFNKELKGRERAILKHFIDDELEIYKETKTNSKGDND